MYAVSALAFLAHALESLRNPSHFIHPYRFETSRLITGENQIPEDVFSMSVRDSKRKGKNNVLFVTFRTTIVIGHSLH